jgi:hypothetical protein
MSQRLFLPLWIGMFADLMSPQQTPLTVCQVLQTLTKIPNGSYVRVGGELVVSEEGLSVKSPNACERGFESDGFRWPDSLALSFSTARGHLFPNTFETQREVVSAIRTLEARRRAGDTERIHVTISGRLERREKYWRKSTKGQEWGNGFGHLSYFPAAVVVHEMSKDGKQ